MCLSLCLSVYVYPFISVSKKKWYYYVYFILFFKIEAPGSNFSLCVVMEKNNIVRDIENLNQPISGDFVYHRWDLNRWPAPCRHFSRYATRGMYFVFDRYEYIFIFHICNCNVSFLIWLTLWMNCKRAYIRQKKPQ